MLLTIRLAIRMKCGLSIQAGPMSCSAMARCDSSASTSILTHGWLFPLAMAERLSVKTTNTAILFCLLLAGCGRPPQMGADKDVFATVDALFTAITAHDEKQLSLCEQRLKGYFEA